MKNIKFWFLLVVVIFISLMIYIKFKGSSIEKVDLDMNDVVLKINNNNYEFVLENNETVNDLLRHFPLTLKMNELNNNEYYAYLDFELKINPRKVNNIEAGDIMLFQDNCLVIFYKSFSTSYSYTKIGHIKNISDLENDLEKGRVVFVG